jgi:uncharacterized protein (TIGR03435 family)
MPLKIGVAATIVLPVALVAGAVATRAAAQPAAPAEHAFEVVSIKANTSGAGPRLIRPMPGGVLSAVNMPLSDLVHFAYGYLGVEFRILGIPAWAGSVRFDVAARMPADRVAQDGTFDIDEMRAMLRTSLRGQFQLDAHRETRDLPMYALLNTRADGRPGAMLRRSGDACPPISVPAWIPAPPPPPPGPGGPLDPNCAGFSVPGFMALRRVTMARFADMLSIFVARLVEDRTGLDGAFDADLNYLPDPAIASQRVRGGPPPDAGAPPSINPDAAELFTALQEQLGLKLEATRGPVDVVVIDRFVRPAVAP